MGHEEEPSSPRKRPGSDLMEARGWRGEKRLKVASDPAKSKGGRLGADETEHHTFITAPAGTSNRTSKAKKEPASLDDLARQHQGTPKPKPSLGGARLLKKATGARRTPKLSKIPVKVRADNTPAAARKTTQKATTEKAPGTPTLKTDALCQPESIGTLRGRHFSLGNYHVLGNSKDNKATNKPALDPPVPPKTSLRQPESSVTLPDNDGSPLDSDDNVTVKTEVKDWTAPMPGPNKTAPRRAGSIITPPDNASRSHVDPVTSRDPVVKTEDKATAHTPARQFHKTALGQPVTINLVDDSDDPDVYAEAEAALRTLLAKHLPKPALNDMTAAFKWRIAEQLSNIAKTETTWVDRLKPGLTAPAPAPQVPDLYPVEQSARGLAAVVRELRVQVGGLHREVSELQERLAVVKQVEAELVVDRREACEEFRRAIVELQAGLIGTQEWVGRLEDLSLIHI